MTRTWKGHTLNIRPGTSDDASFRQIFEANCFGPIADAENVRFVVDAGAYVGFSSLWFLEKFPECHVLAIEPEFDNYRCIAINTTNHAFRVHRMHNALWDRDESVSVVRGRYRDGKDWSTQVCETFPLAPGSIPGLTLPTLTRTVCHDRIDILKIDIEGAEAKVFAGNVDWLDRVRNLVIELHDDSDFGPATPVFFEAIKGCGFAVTQFGELTFCERR